MATLVTGATGFIGLELINFLSHSADRSIFAATRDNTIFLPERIKKVHIESISPETQWEQPLSSGIDSVIHLAARTHIMHDNSTCPLAEFRKINTGSTLNLAHQAASAGVRRFIFLSSIKVNGECTSLGKPFTVDDSHVPTDPYGLSKYEAEQGLRNLALQTGMEVVIIRPPLVYGPGVKANFLSMMRWLRKGIPLPLKTIRNQRSLVALENLVDLITTCIDHPAAANQTFMVSDGEDLSTTALLQRLGSALGKPARLLPVPEYLITTSLTLLGKEAIAQRLCGSLQVDISKTRDLLGWTPPLSVDESLHKTAQAYLSTKP